MSRTSILPSDPAAVKVWSAKIAVEAQKKSFWTKMTGGEDAAMPVVIKSDLESGPGDEVTTTLIAKLRGKPIEGDEKGEGREQRLSHYTHKMRIDKSRQLVNVGDVMSQKRVRQDIAKQARARLSDYMAEVQDELIHMYACGARGVGDEIQHYPNNWTGFPNPLTVPDAAHLQVGDGLTKATLVDGGATSKMSTAVIDRALVRASKMFSLEGKKGARMEPVSVETPNSGSDKCFVLLTSPESMYDLRREVGDAGWLTLEKAKAAAVGAKSPIFQGGDAYYNGALVTKHETCVKFNDYGAGGNVNAVRNLFLGAHAVAVAHGMKGQKGNVRYELSESSVDHGEESVIVVRMIAGFDKTRYNNMDFGVQSIDTAYTTID